MARPPGPCRFNAASINERAHYKEETLVNVGGKRSRRAAAPPAVGPGGVDELVVVTLLVASQHGDLGLPDRIDSLQDLQATLRVLGGLTRDQVGSGQGGRADAGHRPSRRIPPPCVSGCHLCARLAQPLVSGVAPLPLLQVLGVEVMWTPQADTDYYGRDEVAADFPDLVPL